MKLIKILLMASMIILISSGGCTIYKKTNNPMPPKPTKPAITFEKHDGMSCLSKKEAAQLKKYLIDLERGYNQ